MNIVENRKANFKSGELCFEYYYRIIESELNIHCEEGNYNGKVYGLEIERQDYSGEKLVKIVRSCEKVISPKREKVEKLLDLTYENKVSPIHLLDIAGEYIDEYVNDFSI